MKTREEIEKKFIEFIETQDGIECPFGKLKFDKTKRIGQGGNGLVYLAELNKKEVAVKFLIETQNRKKERFKSEFFNTNYVRDKLVQVVNMIYYGEINIDKDIIIPYIIMKKYNKNLKRFREEITEIEYEDFWKLFEFLLKSFQSIHEQGILHRDLKPENILVDDQENYYLGDFGIAYYEKEEFPIDNKTRKGERLANVTFSAPEQINNQYEVTKASDIYSIGQMLYWYIFGKINRGTGGEKIASTYGWEWSNIYDDIINICLRNNPKERFQSVQEIFDYLASKKSQRKEVDVFEDMKTFHDAVISHIPEFYNYPHKLVDKKQIKELLDSIFNRKYNSCLEFNSGKGNDSIKTIEQIENGNYLIDNWREINILNIWGYFTNSIYDDILILELGKVKPYKIGENEYDQVICINNEEIIPYYKAESGYIRYKDSVYKLNDLNYQERLASNEYTMIAIGPAHNCAIIEKNDNYMAELQEKDIDEETILRLKKKIHKNRTYDVSIRI